MQNVYPDYYPQFRCLAGDCRHSCCIGWEIDVDRDTLKKYRRVRGDMGRRLRASVSRGRTPHFLLQSGERCPFLESDGLCALILYGGEDMLCQICRDHPRFRSFLPGRTETGLGLCCEAAARCILSQTERTSLCVTGEADTSDAGAEAFLRLRDGLLALAQERTLPLAQREDAILARCGVTLPERSAGDWAGLLLGLERLDDAWTQKLLMLRSAAGPADAGAFSAHMASRQTEYEKLLHYFLFRHVTAAYPDGDVRAAAAFAVFSVRFLASLGAAQYERSGCFTFDDQAELARLYSAEIEYSQENLDTLQRALLGQECGA